VYRIYLAVVSLADADQLTLEDVANELVVTLDDLDWEQIKPLELLHISRLEHKVGLSLDGYIKKAEATD
jgi:hypothetical protein